jgi:hypothetical protein
VEALAIGGAVDRDGLDAQLAAGLDDAEGDLAPVGDQDLLEHRRKAITLWGGWRTAARRTRPPGRFADRICEDHPSASDSISFISFIASTMHTHLPLA